MRYLLGPTSDIPADGAKQFSIETGNDEPLNLFVVHHSGQFHAYENRCPHVGVALNWQPDVFLNMENTHIQCSTHGAQFRIEDGLCVWGPCVNKSLTPVPLTVENGSLFAQPELKKASPVR